MRENLLAILNKIKDEVIAVPIKVSSKTQSLYDATRYAWNVNKDNRDKINYVVGIDNKIAKIIIKITNRIEVTENTLKPNGEIETDKNRIGRIYFEGEENPNENGLDLILGQDVTDFFGSMNSAIKYPKFISGSRDMKDTNLSMDLLNQILYGPPGTGKTYNTVIKALKIIEPEVIENFHAKGEKYDDYKNKLLPKYNELKKSGQIEFVTFHQSYGYEEFVEGIKPIIENDVDARDFYEVNSRSENKSQLSYEIVSGCFKRVSLLAKKIAATTQKAEIEETSNYWKLSLGNTAISEAEIVYQYCLENNVVQLGYGYGVDLSNANSYDKVKNALIDKSKDKSNDYAFRVCNNFKNIIKIGDFIIVSHGNTKFKAIAQVIDKYTFLPESIANEKGVFTGNLPVKWVYISKDLLPYEKILNKKFSQQALYNIKSNIEMDKFKDFINPDDNNSMNKKYVLIIDEINRGNISKIFGELITLIEESKRAGNYEAMSVTLPYSGESFSVPNNLYIIGTMNTADRSIALMDTALRRRFEFVEMQPKPQLLSENVDGVNLKELLETINQRIEYLYDRDHTIGHAYFMGITDFAGLCNVFANKIIPLLQEYFYDDWEKIRLVLADNQIEGKIKPVELAKKYQFIQANQTNATELFGESKNNFIETDKIIYTINTSLKTQEINVQAFIKIYKIKTTLDEQHAESIASTETSHDQGS